MSAAGTLVRAPERPSTAPTGSLPPSSTPPDAGGPEPPGRPSIAAAVLLFAGLAAFAALHVSGLVRGRGESLAGADARVLLAVAVAAAGGWVLAHSAALRMSRGAALAARSGVALATSLACVAAAGAPTALLAPDRLPELADGLTRGIEGIRTVRWPYQGSDPWVELAVLLPVALVLALAAALCFWPARRGAAALHAAAAGVLVALFAVGVVEHDPGGGLARGALLLVLLAAWAWLPRAQVREAAPAALAVGAAAALALPLAAGLDPGRPLLEYRTWSADAAGARFEWDHRYGPIDWPRTGATLLHVRAPRSHYWKVETLDAFDGARWRRSGAPPGPAGRYELPPDPDPRFFERIEVTIRSLRSDLAVGAGTTLGVTGAGATARSADGTVRLTGERLEEGDSYTAATYVPDPSVERMRDAPSALPPEMRAYTALTLPPGTAAPPGGQVVSTGLRGRPGGLDTAVEERWRTSPYAGVQRLAARLAPAGVSTYEAVRSVESHLRSEYAYTERPPRRRHPLASFLLEDRRGYCQQFSGAMALMLRMRGIPARVAGGFAPGALDRDTGEHRVRDLDAHSWVEVFFPDIGWVPFDPTPAASPAESQSATDLSPSAAGGGTSDSRGGRPPADTGGTFTGAEGPSPDAPARDRSAVGVNAAWWVAAPVGLALLAALAGRGVAAARRSRSSSLEPELRDLESVLARLDDPPGPGVTLSDLEQRFEAAGQPRAARYARALRERRFGPRGGAAPSRTEGRALRRELRRG